jgi:fibrillarin-like pre-rRNA processing protein
MDVNEISEGIFEVRKGGKKILATKNANPGSNVYGENLLEEEGEEYRAWDARRSKLAAMVRELIQLCDTRSNIVPILADASRPKLYAHIVEQVDVIFQDVQYRANTCRCLPSEALWSYR